MPLCPRCGYDQSGACATWQAQCPLEGTCPECGLRFEWADVFNFNRRPLPWLYEHKPRWSPGLLRAWRSWGRTILPTRFWSAVSLTHRTSSAVWLWPVVLFASMIFIGGTGRAIAGCYSKYPWFPYVMTGRFTGLPPRPDNPGFLARVLDVVWVYWFYPLWFNNYGGWTREQYLKQLLDIWAVPAATLGAALACALTLICLRSSRRIATVSSGHIVRAAVYRLAPLVIFYFVWITFFVLQDYRWGPPLGGLEGTVFGALLVGSLAWGWLWWWTAITRGWQMPRARLAAALIGLVDVLAFAAVLLTMSPFILGELTR